MHARRGAGKGGQSNGELSERRRRALKGSVSERRPRTLNGFSPFSCDRFGLRLERAFQRPNGRVLFEGTAGGTFAVVPSGRRRRRRTLKGIPWNRWNHPLVEVSLCPLLFLVAWEKFCLFDFTGWAGTLWCDIPLPCPSWLSTGPSRPVRRQSQGRPQAIA